MPLARGLTTATSTYPTICRCLVHGLRLVSCLRCYRRRTNGQGDCLEQALVWVLLPPSPRGHHRGWGVICHRFPWLRRRHARRFRRNALDCFNTSTATERIDRGLTLLLPPPLPTIGGNSMSVHLWWATLRDQVIMPTVLEVHATETVTTYFYPSRQKGTGNTRKQIGRHKSNIQTIKKTNMHILFVFQPSKRQPLC